MRWDWKIGFYVLMYAIGIVYIFPFVYLLLSSFKTNAELIAGYSLIPKMWTFRNYVQLFNDIPVLRMSGNGLFVAFMATTGGVVSCAMAAFAFAKLKFFAKNTVFVLMLMTLMIPGVVTLVPFYALFKTMNLIDNIWVLILPHWTGSAFGVFFLRQNMMGIPHELYESAKVDGFNPIRILFFIYAPLSMAAIATLYVLFFTIHWNDLFGPLIYINSPWKLTLTVGLAYFRGQFTTNYPVILAGIFISIIPTILIFLFAQKYIVNGMRISGIK